MTEKKIQTSLINMNNIYEEHKNEHHDEDSIDTDYCIKDYAILEHLSNARLMPMTGPYGGLDLIDTYEYGSIPVDPATPMDSYEIIMEKNSEKQ